MTLPLTSDTSADSRCPRCHARLEEEIGQEDATGRGYLAAIRRCPECPYVEEQGRNDFKTFRQEFNEARIKLRRLQAKERAEGEEITLRYDLPAVEEVETWD